jgi:PAS domain S-box-containing protein
MHNSLRFRLTVIIISLAVGPLILAGAVMSWRTYTVQKKQALNMQRDSVRHVADHVQYFALELENQLQIVVQTTGLDNLPLKEQEAVLAKLMAHHNNFQELSLVDASGRERLLLHRVLMVTPEMLRDRSNDPAFTEPMRTGETYYGPVEFDTATKEPFMDVSIPVIRPRTGTVNGVLFAQTRWKSIWDLIGGLELWPGESVYVLDQTGRVVAHRNPSVVLRETVYKAPFDESIHEGLDHRRALAASAVIKLGNQSFRVVAERDVSKALALAYNAVFISVVLIAVLLVVAVGLIVLVVGNIIHPLRELADAAGEIEAGDLTVRAVTDRRDEIGDLAVAFNNMTGRLSLSLERFEKEAVERQQALVALSQSEARFRQLAENIQEVFWVVSPDWQKVHYISPAYEQVWGRSCESLYDNPLSWLDAVLEEDRQRVIDYLQSKADGDLDEISFPDYRIRRSDGAVLWIRARGFPVTDQDGRVYRLVGIAEDITERKSYDEALQKSEEQLRMIADNLPVLISYLDHEVRYRFVNQQYLPWYDVPLDHIIGRTMKSLLGENNYADIKPYVDKVLTGEMVSYEGRLVLGSGRIIDFHARYIPHFDKDRRVKGFFNLVQDITRRKAEEQERARLESQLRQSHKMEAVGKLAGGIAHDFNNILSAIIGYTELAVMDAEDNQAITQNLNNVITAAGRAKTLIQQILAFSRKAQQEMIALDLKPLIRESLDFLRATLPASIEIRSLFSFDRGVVMADPTQIHQVILNLCTNAAHAMRRKGGTLEVALGLVDGAADESLVNEGMPEGQYVKLSVSDTGHGIGPEIMERIFEPFFTTKEPGEGTGMGLAMAHGIVRSHGGIIRAFSEPERGTTFEVFLPMVATETRIEPEHQAPVLQGKERILLVDDEESLVDIGRKMLERLGYTVTAYTDSLEALEAIKGKKHEFDLVITDQTMPKMTGLDLAREIRRINEDAPIILCSGYTESISPETAKEEGISAFLMKPLSLHDLAATIRLVLDGESDESKRTPV